MRNHYTSILKTFFHEKLFRRRVELDITQEEMAARLFMASRTYVDLDHGKTGCSALTFALFLVYICADPLIFLEELRDALETVPTKQRKRTRIPAYLYRIPHPVTEVVVYSNGDSYPVCPRCECTLDREYMRFCDRCGQRLFWATLDTAKIAYTVDV